MLNRLVECVPDLEDLQSFMSMDGVGVSILMF